MYLLLAGLALPSVAQTIQPGLIKPQDRIVSAVNPVARVAMADSVHPALLWAQSSQPVERGFAVDHIMLNLQPSATQQAALTALLSQQQDPKSPNFHKFLTPAQFAASFGVSSSDVNKITAWLTGSGFHIDEVAANNLAIVFSGTASQVEAAFNTQIRQYIVNGETHYANSTAAEIPSALSPVVQGLVKLNDFHSKSPALHVKAIPQFTSGTGAHYLVPADYAVIYNLNPLYSVGTNGTAQSIAVVGRSNVNPADIATFRATYGLPANAITPVFAVGSDPGISGDENTLEATLDVEWAGAIAPNANIKYVMAASTAASDGVDLAVQYAVAHNVAPVLSVSYSTCEAVANNAFYNTLWQQAAVQGITVVVAAGDTGAAGCDAATAASGTVRAVNALCSTPYDTCVGGTLFSDTSNPGQYWLPGNNAVLGSAISYIPETAWNESGLVGGTGLSAGGGGVSGLYLKPYYQTGLGVPADGHRDVPDVSLSAGQHDGYMIYYNGAAMSAAGTSVATPSFAAMMALVNQVAGDLQGNINQVLYPLAAATQNAAAPVFHDITSGNNSVPGVSGYNATAGYDLATGLGSVNAAQLAGHYAPVAGGFTLTASVASLRVTPGATGYLNLVIVDQGTFNAPVSLNVSGLPPNVVANFAPGSASGNFTSVLNVGAYGSALSGTYPITVTATGGGFTRSVSFNLVVVVSTSCTLTAAPASLVVVETQSIGTKLMCGSAQGVFSTSLVLTISGAPAGVTTSFSPGAMLAAGQGVVTLAVNTNSSAIPGTYLLLVTATLPNASPAVSSTARIPLTINAAASFKVTPSVSALNLPQGTSGTILLTSLHQASFNSPISFQISGLPSTVSAALSASSLAAPGDGSLTITLQALSIATPKAYTLMVLAQGGGLALTIPIAVQVTLAPAFTMTASAAVLTLRQTYVPAAGTPTPATASLVFNIGALTNSFNSPVAFSILGALPSGVTATFSPALLAAPGSGLTTLTLTASATATTGISTFTVAAAGGSITRYANVELILTTPPTFNLAVSYLSYNVTAGSSINETVSATPVLSYAANLYLSVASAPGITAAFAPAVISSNYGTSKLTLQCAANLSPGAYTITVKATDPVSGRVQTAAFSLTVTP